MTLRQNDSEEVLHVDRPFVLTERDVQKITMAEGNEIGLIITLTSGGAKKLAELTEEMLGKRLAIVAGGRLVMAPVVRQIIRGGSLQITGNLSRQEAKEVIQTFEEFKKRGT
ncbi:MAG: hypothetical protein SNJ84_07200 [Verrucomicrobiia bacterium]